MKIIFAFFVYAFTIAGAFAAGENVPTSQSFVDTAIAQKQAIIPANDGSAQVLTNTGAAGEIGTKNIYDSTDTYAPQMDSLVTAEQFNTAVQNAIDAEFVCVSWVNDDPNDECLLLEIRSATPKRSPNLFRGPYLGGINMTITTTQISNYTLTSPYTPPSQYTGPVFIARVVPGETYYISFKTDAYYRFIAFYANEEDVTNYEKVLTFSSVPGNRIVTVPNNANVIALSFTNADKRAITWSDVQIELGTAPTPYQPYGQNIYMPSGD